MKQLALMLLLIGCIFATADAKPPFGGTIGTCADIITDDDPTALEAVTPAGRGERRMFDRRVNKWITVDAHLFNARFDDGQEMEVQVNPEFTAEEAFEQAKKYLPTIGQLPYCLRKDAKTVWIHKGGNGFGGGNRNLLIHTKLGEAYIRGGILAEAFMHEAAHTSLDAAHAKSKGWLAAQKKDPEFISGYAKQNPVREDIAETYLLYFALRYKPERLKPELQDKIANTIPHRIAYFDSLDLEMHPVKVPMRRNDTQEDAKALTKPQM